MYQPVSSFVNPTTDTQTQRACWKEDRTYKKNSMNYVRKQKSMYMFCVVFLALVWFFISLNWTKPLLILTDFPTFSQLLQLCCLQPMAKFSHCHILQVSFQRSHFICLNIKLVVTSHLIELTAYFNHNIKMEIKPCYF